MRKYLIIPGLLLAFFLFSAKSCDEDTEENRRLEEVEMKEAIDSVKGEFEAEFLTEESLFAFEQKAKQKLRDFADYWNIANDTSLDSAFRGQAETMSKNLFYLQQVPMTSRHPTFEIFIDSIHVVQPLQRTVNSGYYGILGFKLEVREYTLGDTVITGPNSKMIEMVATKTASPFGSDTLKIWKVYLGKMVNW